MLSQYYKWIFSCHFSRESGSFVFNFPYNIPNLSFVKLCSYVSKQNKTNKKTAGKFKFVINGFFKTEMLV